MNNQLIKSFHTSINPEDLLKIGPVGSEIARLEVGPLKKDFKSKEETQAKHKKHLKNVGPIHNCEPPHAHSPDVASGTVTRRLRIDVHDNADDDNDDNDTRHRGDRYGPMEWAQ